MVSRRCATGGLPASVFGPGTGGRAASGTLIQTQCADMKARSHAKAAKNRQGTNHGFGKQFRPFFTWRLFAFLA